MRTAEINRKTNETNIALTLNLDGNGTAKIDTGCGFFNHMLELFARHARMDLTVQCKGDTDVDYHHTVEDIGIALGQAFKAAIGNKAGITRYGSMLLPMDEALVGVSLDISGRSYLSYIAYLPTDRVGNFDTELAEEFFQGFVRNADITLHIKQLEGNNSHHIIESMFKAVGRALRTAVALDPALQGEIPSTKGLL